MSVLDKIKQQVYAQDGSEEIFIYLTSKEMNELGKVRGIDLERIDVGKVERIYILKRDL